MMKLLRSSPRPGRHDEPTADSSPLLPSADGSDVIALTDVSTDDDDVDFDFDDDGGHGDDLGAGRDTQNCHSFPCPNCRPRGHDRCVQSCHRWRDGHASSADVIEICVAAEEGKEGEREQTKKKKKKKKPLKKRVRKGVWRAMRSSWKYLRRGMSGYAPGLSYLFNWGVNLNRAAATVRTSAPERRYF
ncbi:uncharacterized protein LOC143296367 [Babylonia areolata]|uniref:uncharacterized protein LOC143296367 n=1 Tax=Babylonia areolata TaxID=304850 RepID=UPI003FCFCC9E